MQYVSAVRYFEFSRVSKQKCHVFFLNVKNIIDKVKFTLDKCGDVDVVVAMRTRNDFASAYVFVDYRNLPQLGRSNIRVWNDESMVWNNEKNMHPPPTHVLHYFLDMAKFCSNFSRKNKMSNLYFLLCFICLRHSIYYVCI